MLGLDTGQERRSPITTATTCAHCISPVALMRWSTVTHGSLSLHWDRPAMFFSLSKVQSSNVASCR